MAQFEDASTDERTETATPFRREEFRRKGHVAISKEVLSVLLLGLVASSMFFLLQMMFKEFAVLCNHFLNFNAVGNFTRDELLYEMGIAGRSLAWMIFPILGIAFVVGILACVVQIGFNVTAEPLVPNWDRLNPINDVKRLFSVQGSVEAFKAVIKLCLCMAILWFFLKAEAPKVGQLLEKNVEEVTGSILRTVAKLFFTVLGSLGVMAALDFLFQRLQLERQLKMTKREAKEEFKLREGDPLIKQRIRSIQRRMANSRMMQKIPEADVVVTNPTHLAVALKYDPKEMHAPKVLAKGAGEVALKIREIAKFHRVPIVENKPLARTLFRTLDINEFIPKELYVAVSEVLRYVYRLKGIILNGQ